MTTTVAGSGNASLTAARPKPPTDPVSVDLLMPEPAGCAPCRNAIEEIDDAAALLAEELAARGTALQVRVKIVRRQGARRIMIET